MNKSIVCIYICLILLVILVNIGCAPVVAHEAPVRGLVYNYDEKLAAGDRFLGALFKPGEYNRVLGMCYDGGNKDACKQVQAARASARACAAAVTTEEELVDCTVEVYNAWVRDQRETDEDVRL